MKKYYILVQFWNDIYFLFSYLVIYRVDLSLNTKHFRSL